MSDVSATSENGFRGGRPVTAEIEDGPVEDVPVEVVRAEFSARRHRVMLATCAAVVLLSFGLTVTPADEVAPRIAPHRPLPDSCVSRSWFGVECPGCGLTRSFVQLAALRPAASLAAHPLGWLLAVYVVAQFPYRAAALRRQVHHPYGRRWPRLLGNGLIVLFFVVWLVRLGWTLSPFGS
jgi:hypothetical protein